jgi:hypothetical protein
MRLAVITLFVCTLIISCGCSSQSTSQPTAAPSPAPSVSPLSRSASSSDQKNPTQSPNTAAVPKATVDACTLLTSDEIKAVQGEALKETKPSNPASGDFLVSQCYYELPTPVNSVSLSITETNPANQSGHSLKEFWETTFGKDESKSEREREKEREEAKKSKPRAEREGGEEEESAPMEPVRGVGDEAFWSGNSVGGVLYVLKGDRFIRISVGGKGNAEAKLRRSKTLAEKAVRRL